MEWNAFCEIIKQHRARRVMCYIDRPTSRRGSTW